MSPPVKKIHVPRDYTKLVENAEKDTLAIEAIKINGAASPKPAVKLKPQNLKP